MADNVECARRASREKVINWSGEWLRIDDLFGCGTHTQCDLCTKQKTLCNFSSLFVNGITGSGLKKDNVVIPKLCSIQSDLLMPRITDTQLLI